MKKLVSVLFVSLLVGGIAFAADPSISLTGWGRYIYNTVDSDATGAVDGLATSTDPAWANGGQVRFTVKGTSDNVGFQIDTFWSGMSTASAALTGGDQAKIWIKFNDMFTLQGGKIMGDTLRGKVGSSDLIGTTDEDYIFERHEISKGLLLEVKPMKELYISASIDSAAGTTETTLSTTYENIQIGAGYTIDKVGVARVQYVPRLAGKPINAAFAYTGMAGLTVDAGVFVPTTDAAKLSIGASAKYAQDALGLVVRTVTTLSDPLAFRASVDVNYMVAKPLTAGLEAEYTKAASDTFEVAPYAKLAYGNGYIKAAFYATMAGSTTTWSIPVLMNYAF